MQELGGLGYEKFGSTGESNGISVALGSQICQRKLELLIQAKGCFRCGDGLEEWIGCMENQAQRRALTDRSTADERFC